MSVRIFFDPDLVGQLAACGITRRSGQAPGPPRGFVLGGRAPGGRGGRAVTHVIDARGHVTITGSRRQPVGRPAATFLAEATEPRTALELAEECARLRRDNQRLSDEVARLRVEADRQVARSRELPQREATELDDAARRFSLLELE